MNQSHNEIKPDKNKPVWSFNRLIGKTNGHLECFMNPNYCDMEGVKKMVKIIRGTDKFSVEQLPDELVLNFEDGHKEYLKIDYACKSLTLQGMWWYRGVYSLIVQDDNYFLSLKIYNIAPKFRWAASLMILPEKKKHEIQFNKLIEDLSNLD